MYIDFVCFYLSLSGTVLKNSEQSMNALIPSSTTLHPDSSEFRDLGYSGRKKLIKYLVLTTHKSMYIYYMS